MDIIKIPRLNDFTLAFPFVERTFVDSKAVDTPLDLAQYTDIQITVESQDGTYKENYNGTIDGNILSVEFQETLPINTYNVVITGKYNGADKTTLLKRCFSIVSWNYQSNWKDYIEGSPILTEESVFVCGSSNNNGMKTLVINVPLEDLARIINSSKTEDGFPDEYLVNADLGFGMNEINAFIEGKLNVQLMTNIKGVLSDEDLILTMMLDNVIVQEIPKEENILLNGERVIYAITLTYINDGAFTCEFALSEHYCTAIVNKAGIPDYSNAIAEAKQMAINAQQTADEALQATQEITDPTNGGQTTINDALNNVYSATQVTDPTNGSYPTQINDALYNVHMEADAARNDALNAQSSADSAYQRAEEAYNRAMGIVVPPDNSYEVQQAQSRADEAYTRADEAYTRAYEAYNEASNAASAASRAQSTANEALGATQVTDPTTNSPGVAIGDALSNVYNNLNDKIMQDDDGLAFALLLMLQVARDFTADLSLIGDGKCISISSSERYNGIFEINDAFFNEMYLTFKSGENIDAGDMFSNYISENTSRKVTLKFGGETLPTFKMTNVAYPDYNLDIIIDDIHVRQMIESQLGVSNVVALRMLEEPLTVGDNNDSCYWALVAEDGAVHNPGTY